MEHFFYRWYRISQQQNMMYYWKKEEINWKPNLLSNGYMYFWFVI